MSKFNARDHVAVLVPAGVLTGQIQKVIVGSEGTFYDVACQWSTNTSNGMPVTVPKPVIVEEHKCFETVQEAREARRLLREQPLDYGISGAPGAPGVE